MGSASYAQHNIYISSKMYGSSVICNPALESESGT